MKIDQRSRPSTRDSAVRIARSSGSKRGRGDLALQDRELVAQHEDLDILGTIASAAQHQQVDHEADKTVETGHAPILAASEPGRSHQRVTPVQYTRTGIRHPHVVTPLTSRPRRSSPRSMRRALQRLCAGSAPARLACRCTVVALATARAALPLLDVHPRAGPRTGVRHASAPNIRTDNDLHPPAGAYVARFTRPRRRTRAGPIRGCRTSEAEQLKTGVRRRRQDRLSQGIPSKFPVAHSALQSSAGSPTVKNRTLCYRTVLGCRHVGFADAAAEERACTPSSRQRNRKSGEAYRETSASRPDGRGGAADSQSS